MAISNIIFAALISLACACNFIYDYPNNIGPSDSDTDDGTGADTDAQQDPTGEDPLPDADVPDAIEDAQDAADAEEEEEPPPENYTWDIEAEGGFTSGREYALLVPLWQFQQESDLIAEHAAGCWHLDTNANDSCGTNHGTAFGISEGYPSVPQSDFRSSYYFSGDDEILLTDGDALDGWTGLTVGAWVMPGSECRSEKTIFSWDSPAGGSGIMSCVDTDHAYWRILGETGEGGIVDVDNVFIDFGRWYHVVGRFDGSTSRLYVDGQLIGSAGFEDTIDNAGEIGIGVNVNGGADHGGFWTGKIDEVVIFGYALDDYEIGHMHAQDCWKFDVAYPYYLDFFDGDAELSEEAIETTHWNQWEQDIGDAVLYFRCNGDFANEAGDPDGTRMGGASADADSLPDLQGACAFDGNGDMVDTHISTMEYINGFTVCMFVSREDWDAPDHAHIAGEHDGGSGGWLLRIKDNSQLQLYGADPDNDPKVSLSELRDGAMHYICGVSEGTTKSLYVDGVLVDSYVHAWNTFADGTFRFGGSPQCDTNPTWAFDGRIDEVRLWTRPRTAEEIRTDLAPDYMRVWTTDISGLETTARTTGDFYAHDDFGLAADYWFNEGGGAILHDFDRVGDSRDNATIYGATWSTDTPNDCFDYSLAFNGVDDYVKMNAVSLPAAGFAYCAWVKTTDDDGIVMLKGPAEGSGHGVRGYGLFAFSNVCFGSGAGYRCSGETLDGGWHHACGTYLDGSTNWSDIRIYIDGAEATGYTATGDFYKPHVDSLSVFLGSDDGESTFFEGSITGARIFNRDLPAGEIEALYNNGDCLQFSVSDPMPIW
ncbi:MAG: LamG domain-containing protein [Pseudomonadota bacterium]